MVVVVGVEALRKTSEKLVSPTGHPSGAPPTEGLAPRVLLPNWVMERCSSIHGFPWFPF